jgi:hypothetical protein
MRSKLIAELLSKEYAIGIWLLLALALVTVAIFRRKRWVIFIWVPALCWSAVLSCLALALFLMLVGMKSSGGGTPAQFILAAAFVFAPFAILLCMAIFFRPHREAFKRSSTVLALLLAACASAALFALPRPKVMAVQIRILDSNHTPVPDAAVTFSAFGGKGGNYDGNGLTDAQGCFTLFLYYPEWGQIAISAPAGDAKLSYEFWPEIMVEGKPNGVRITAPTHADRAEEGGKNYTRRTITANSDEIYDILLRTP